MLNLENDPTTAVLCAKSDSFSTCVTRNGWLHFLCWCTWLESPHPTIGRAFFLLHQHCHRHPCPILSPSCSCNCYRLKPVHNNSGIEPPCFHMAHDHCHSHCEGKDIRFIYQRASVTSNNWIISNLPTFLPKFIKIFLYSTLKQKIWLQFLYTFRSFRAICEGL